jgi:hypothetical protein
VKSSAVAANGIQRRSKAKQMTRMILRLFVF